MESSEKHSEASGVSNRRLVWAVAMAVVGIVGMLATVVFLAPSLKKRVDSMVAELVLKSTGHGPPKCQYKLRQIGIALQNYHAANGSFPPAYTVDENGQRLHSWRTLILPYMEGHSLYNRFDMTEPWDSPTNQKAATAMLDERYLVYVCPESRRKSLKTSYVMIVGPNTISSGEKGVGLSEITDGPSKTILLVEIANSDIQWSKHETWRPTRSPSA